MSSIMSGVNRNTTRTVRKIEAPRPLRLTVPSSAYSIDSVEKLVTLMDMVVETIYRNDISRNSSGESSILLTSNIIHLCKHIAIFGPQLESPMYQGHLDRACEVFRDSLVQGVLEYSARSHLLDILELRDRSWIPATPINGKNVSTSHESDGFSHICDVMNSVKQYKINCGESMSSLSSDEVLRRYTKHRDKSVKTSNRNYCKDEIVIRNSDSGKVSPTAKERLVQITGATEDNVSHATRLIDNTIRNNSSPVKELCSSDSKSSSEESLLQLSGGCDDYEYKKNLNNSLAKINKSHSFGGSQSYLYRHKVLVSNCHLSITGDDYTYVTVAKAVLDDYFSKLRRPGNDNGNENSDLFLKGQSSSSMNNTKRSPGPNVFNFSQLMISEKTGVPSITSYITNEYCVPATLKMEDLIDGVQELGSIESNNDDAQQSINVFTREFLLECRNSELSQQKPKDWETLVEKFPEIVKNWDDSKNIIDTIVID